MFIQAMHQDTTPNYDVTNFPQSRVKHSLLSMAQNVVAPESVQSSLLYATLPSKYSIISAL